MLAGVHDQLAFDRAHPILLVLWVELMPGDHESIHVGDAPAWRKD